MENLKGEKSSPGELFYRTVQKNNGERERSYMKIREYKNCQIQGETLS